MTRNDLCVPSFALLGLISSACDDPAAATSGTEGGETGDDDSDDSDDDDDDDDDDATTGGGSAGATSASTTAGPVTSSDPTLDPGSTSGGQETQTGDAETDTGGPACTNEDEDVTCYDGDPETLDVGICVAGVSSCEAGDWSACAGQRLPEREVCNGLDDDCDGVIDEECECLADETRPCYEGTTGTAGVGQCTDGIESCEVGSWGECEGQTVPDTETCNGVDDDCDGDVDEGCDCLPGAAQSCYTGPTETQDVGACSSGTQTCSGTGAWGPCNGDTTPIAESCNSVDDDCDGILDELDDPGACDTGDDGVCSGGVQSCSAGALVCEPIAAPEAEVCDGLDNNCNGTADEGLTDDPILLEGELPDAWSSSVLVGSYPSVASGLVPARLDTIDDVDWFSVYADEQVLDVFGDTPVRGTVSIASPGTGFSYRVCACWSTANALCGKNSSGGIASCATAINGGVATVSVDMAMIQGTNDTGYLDVEVTALAGSQVGCETYDAQWAVTEN